MVFEVFKFCGFRVAWVSSFSNLLHTAIFLVRYFVDQDRISKFDPCSKGNHDGILFDFSSVAVSCARGGADCVRSLRQRWRWRRRAV